MEDWAFERLPFTYKSPLFTKRPVEALVKLPKLVIDTPVWICKLPLLVTACWALPVIERKVSVIGMIILLI
jgi:hypothetical protein